MTATYTFDVFSSLDGFGRARPGTRGGYLGKQGPELLEHRLAAYSKPAAAGISRGISFSAVRELYSPSATEESEIHDAWVARMLGTPATVVSSVLTGPLDPRDATFVSGDAVDVIARLKQDSEVPLRSHGSLSLNRALMAAGLVDRVQVTVFPVITGENGVGPIFQGAADFDLALIDSKTLDGNIQELTYTPTLHA